MLNHEQNENSTSSEHSAALAAALSSEWLEKAKNYALKCHEETNHTYDGKPYSVHLQIAFDYACKYAYLLPQNALISVLAATWTHDILKIVGRRTMT